MMCLCVVRKYVCAEVLVCKELCVRACMHACLQRNVNACISVQGWNMVCNLLVSPQIVPGETDAFSLLFNAYAVCRLAPSVVQNYLAMVQEAHERKTAGEKADLEVTICTFLPRLV